MLAVILSRISRLAGGLLLFLVLCPASAPAQAGESEARAALRRGRPYLASGLLAPLVARPAGPRPETVLLAARAAAGWEGWGTVVQLLDRESWLDSLEGGEGRALLARARVERSEPAVEDARRAVALASPANRGARLVVLARAFDRADQLDSAGSTYLRAATGLPEAAEWLRLRAAGVVADSAARTALFQSLSRPAVVSRIGWTDALARSRSGDEAGAARVYAGLGAPLPAIRMRLRASGPDSGRAALRLELLNLIERGPAEADLRAAVSLLDGLGALSPTEELMVARRLAALDPNRAVAGFTRAAGTSPLRDSDRLAWGMALARRGQHREALPLFTAVRAPETIAQARYQRARSLLALGQRGNAALAFRSVFVSMPGRHDSATFAAAGYLAADLLVDNGDDSAARHLYQQVSRRFPDTGHGPRAAFQAALIAWISGDRVSAAREFTALAKRAGNQGEGIAALYWGGRVLWDAGDTARAGAQWRSLLRRFPSSYYAFRAAERLGLPLAPPATAGLEAPLDSAMLPEFERAALLERLGLKVEARFEYDRIARLAEATPASRLAIARIFQDRGMTGRAFRLAQPVADVTQTLLYPLGEIPFLLEEARRAGVDPLLAAALIRQESGYELGARSRADARGWMQVMPPLGASLARAAGIREWNPDLLHQPEINLRFGMTHLAEILRRYPDLPIALAAYNAGSRAAVRWSRFRRGGATQDLEVYIERIQYSETRDYVRRVLRNYAVYRELYRQ